MPAQPLRMSGLHVTLCVTYTVGVPVGTDVLDPWNALADWAGGRRPDVRSRSPVRGAPRPQTRCSAKKHHTPEQIIVPPATPCRGHRAGGADEPGPAASGDRPRAPGRGAGAVVCTQRGQGSRRKLATYATMCYFVHPAAGGLLM